MLFNSHKYREIKTFISDKYQKTVVIVAISKNHPYKSIQEAISFGVRVFGENRVQEAHEKFFGLKKEHKDIELHLTGALQTNKVKKALEIFDVFQTLDREKLAKEFYKFQEKIKEKKFFIQINIGKEKTKSGIWPEEAGDFIGYCKNDLKMNIVGLMCIPPYEKNPHEFFQNMKSIGKLNNVKLLSMGMSDDYEEAIKCGADFIRIGTALFGKRKKWKYRSQLTITIQKIP